MTCRRTNAISIQIQIHLSPRFLSTFRSSVLIRLKKNQMEPSTYPRTRGLAMTLANQLPEMQACQWTANSVKKWMQIGTGNKTERPAEGNTKTATVVLELQIATDEAMPVGLGCLSLSVTLLPWPYVPKTGTTKASTWTTFTPVRFFFFSSLFFYGGPSFFTNRMVGQEKEKEDVHVPRFSWLKASAYAAMYVCVCMLVYCGYEFAWSLPSWAS